MLPWPCRPAGPRGVLPERAGWGAGRWGSLHGVTQTSLLPPGREHGEGTQGNLFPYAPLPGGSQGPELCLYRCASPGHGGCGSAFLLAPLPVLRGSQSELLPALLPRRRALRLCSLLQDWHRSTVPLRTAPCSVLPELPAGSNPRTRWQTLWG